MMEPRLKYKNRTVDHDLQGFASGRWMGRRQTTCLQFYAFYSHLPLAQEKIVVRPLSLPS